MTRFAVHSFLTVSLLAAAAFAGWSWFRPYAWSPDPEARFNIVETLVTPDASFFWVNVHLKAIPGTNHDLLKPVTLETASGKRLEPADTMFGSLDGQPNSELWIKFWLESTDIEGPLTLHINDGKLVVKSGKGVPRLESSAYRNFTTNRW